MPNYPYKKSYIDDDMSVSVSNPYLESPEDLEMTEEDRLDQEFENMAKQVKNRAPKSAA